MRYVAFFRNVNLGQKGCPNKTGFEAAFTGCGAKWAQSFLTNGTLVFAAPSDAAARRILRAARASLAASCGLEEPVFLRRLEQMARLVAGDPFAKVDRRGVYRFCVSFFDGKVTPRGLPRSSNRGDVEVVRLTGGELLSIVRKIGSGPGSPTLLLEQSLGRPATTRVWNTLVRLVARHHQASCED